MDRIVLAETPLPETSRVTMALQNPFSPIFTRESIEQDFEVARWKAIEEFCRFPEAETFSTDSIFAWSEEKLDKTLKWLRMIHRIAGVKNSTFTTAAAGVFAARVQPLWISRPELLFDWKIFFTENLHASSDLF